MRRTVLIYGEVPSERTTQVLVYFEEVRGVHAGV
jgi:hypothetical protein